MATPWVKWRRYRADVKEYAVLVSLKDPTAELKLGMTALAEIDVSQSGRK